MEELLGSPQGEVLMQNVVHMVPSPYTYPLMHASTRLCLKGSGLLAASSPTISRCVFYSVLCEHNMLSRCSGLPRLFPDGPSRNYCAFL